MFFVFDFLHWAGCWTSFVKHVTGVTLLILHYWNVNVPHLLLPRKQFTSSLDFYPMLFSFLKPDHLNCLPRKLSHILFHFNVFNHIYTHIYWGFSRVTSTIGRLNKFFFFIWQNDKFANCSLCSKLHLKFLELLLGSSSLCHFEHVESHGLAEWSALSDGDNVSNHDIPAIMTRCVNGDCFVQK